MHFVAHLVQNKNSTHVSHGSTKKVTTERSNPTNIFHLCLLFVLIRYSPCYCSKAHRGKNAIEYVCSGVHHATKQKWRSLLPCYKAIGRLRVLCLVCTHPFDKKLTRNLNSSFRCIACQTSWGKVAIFLSSWTSKNVTTEIETIFERATQYYLTWRDRSYRS